MKKRIALLAFVCLLLAASCALAKEHDKHGYGSWRTKRAATCTQTGLQFKYCNGCDHWEKRELPRLPHDVAEWTVTTEPTCTSIGSDAFTDCTALLYILIPASVTAIAEDAFEGCRDDLIVDRRN